MIWFILIAPVFMYLFIDYLIILAGETTTNSSSMSWQNISWCTVSCSFVGRGWRWRVVGNGLLVCASDCVVGLLCVFAARLEGWASGGRVWRVWKPPWVCRRPSVRSIFFFFCPRCVFISFTKYCNTHAYTNKHAHVAQSTTVNMSCCVIFLDGCLTGVSSAGAVLRTAESLFVFPVRVFCPASFYFVGKANCAELPVRVFVRVCCALCCDAHS